MAFCSHCIRWSNAGFTASKEKYKQLIPAANSSPQHALEESVPSENYRLIQGEVIMLVGALRGEVLSTVYHRQAFRRAWGRLQANREPRLLQSLLHHH